MGQTRPYLDIFIQLQCVKTDILAQVFFLDEELCSVIDGDAGEKPEPPAFIQGKRTFFVQLADFGRLLNDSTNLGEALYRLLFIGLDEIHPEYGEKLERGKAIGDWLFWSMEAAQQRGKPLRIRLQVNQAEKLLQPAWHQLRETKILQPLAAGEPHPDRAEAEKDETIDWLLYLPWETLLSELWPKQAHLQGVETDWASWAGEPQALSLVRTLPLVRPYTREMSSPAAYKRSPKGTLSVFLTWASPQELAETDPDISIPEIRQRLEGIDGFSVTVLLDHVTYDELKSRLGQEEWDIVHILAHGTPDTTFADKNGLAFPIADVGLILETRDHSSQRVSGYQLVDMITSQGHPPPQLVFLQACDSAAVYGDLFRGLAQSLIAAGVQYVVAMQAPIGIDVAGKFALKFYEELANWQPVDRAISVARAELRSITEKADISNNPILKELSGSPSIPTWSIPVLFMRDEADGWFAQGPPPEAIRWIDGKIMLLIDPATGDPPFYIDKYPVTVGQFKRYKPGWESPFKGSLTNKVDINKIPATYIDIKAIAGYLNEYQKQLPTPTQWLAALTNGGKTKYPWGDEFDPEQCNCRQCQKSRPAEVTEFEKQENSRQPQDMLGNCLELVLDRAGNYHIIGGSYLSDQPESMTVPAAFPGKRQIIGFRCSVDLKTFRHVLTQKNKDEHFVANRSDRDQL